MSPRRFKARGQPNENRNYWQEISSKCAADNYSFVISCSHWRAGARHGDQDCGRKGSREFRELLRPRDRRERLHRRLAGSSRCDPQDGWHLVGNGTEWRWAIGGWNDNRPVDSDTDNEMSIRAWPRYSPLVLHMEPSLSRRNGNERKHHFSITNH